jgi:multisubunit Na+/H+ antiporter MnhG subunit
MDVIKSLVKSKKSVTTYIGLIAMAAATYFIMKSGYTFNEAKELLLIVNGGIAVLVSGYNVGQGMADSGKEAEKAKAAKQ